MSYFECGSTIGVELLAYIAFCNTNAMYNSTTLTYGPQKKVVLKIPKIYKL